MSTILCINDEPVIRAMLEPQLAELGHEPLVVTSIEDGLRVLARHTVDLVISDCPMSGASGPDLLAVLRERAIGVPIILMAAYSSIERERAGMRHGAVEYVGKPLRAETLRLAVTHGIEASRLRLENASLRREVEALRGPRVIPDESATINRYAPGEAPINLRQLERIAIGRALAATGGHRTRAAGLLGISERTLRNKLNTPPAA
jgi:DNA-binding NtrC family response regulator